MQKRWPLTYKSSITTVELKCLYALPTRKRMLVKTFLPLITHSLPSSFDASAWGKKGILRGFSQLGQVCTGVSYCVGGEVGLMLYCSQCKPPIANYPWEEFQFILAEIWIFQAYLLCVCMNFQVIMCRKWRANPAPEVPPTNCFPRWQPMLETTWQECKFILKRS